MKILVTGGAGYVGSHCVEKLLEANYEVSVLDNLILGHRQAVPKEAKFYKADLADKNEILRVFKSAKFEAVMHFASYSQVGESMRLPFKYLRDNTVNALNLLEVMTSFGVKKFILSSTAALFDKPAKLPITESAQVTPGSPYGESKNIIERYLYWLDKIYNFRYSALRYFNAAGASPSGKLGEDHNPETHLIPLVIAAALEKNKSMTVFGNNYKTRDGTCIRDYVHVCDLADAHVLALKYLEKNNISDKFNLGNENGNSVLEVIETAKKITGIDFPVIKTERRIGDPAKLYASSKKAQEIIGWQPKFGSIEKIIETAWNWHKNNPNGFEK